MENENFVCNMCSVFSTNSFKSFQNHYVRRHKNEPNFYVACNIEGCAYTTKRWGTFRVHIHRKHSNVYMSEESEVQSEDTINESFEDEQSVPSEELKFDPLHFNTLFALSLETKQNVSKRGIDDILSSTSSLVENHIIRDG